MTFNWIDFLRSNNIEYTTSSPNTKKGELSIKCPMCVDDPSMHLGINPNNGKWACWRSADHRGIKPYRLIVALLGCSYAHARLIVDQYSITDADEFNKLDMNFSTKKKEDQYQRLKLPEEFRKIKRMGSTRRFWKYLYNRGFKEVDDLTFEYNLKCCTTGYWKDRIIIPIYEKGELITWTSRAIVETEIAPRYLTLSENEKGPDKALINIKDTIYLYDQLEGGEALFITEGPIDALKIDFYGYPYEVSATCLFSSSITISQVYLIAEVSKLYKSTWLLLDPEAFEETLTVHDILVRYGVKVGSLEEGIEDPGKMSKKQVVNLIKRTVVV